MGTYFLNNPVDIAPTYEGRAFLEVDMDRKESTLRLTKVTMKDSRRFQCSVIIPNDDEGVTAASTSLLVLGKNEWLWNNCCMQSFIYVVTFLWSWLLSYIKKLFGCSATLPTCLHNSGKDWVLAKYQHHLQVWGRISRTCHWMADLQCCKCSQATPTKDNSKYAHISLLDSL